MHYISLPIYALLVKKICPIKKIKNAKILSVFCKNTAA